jgi:spermidine synthase
MHRLENGTTLHGIQKMGRRRRLPTSYFGAATGVGLVLGSRDGAAASRIGVVGLGIGTLASYAHAGGTIRFYEIDPVVVRIARDDGLFHYLEDSASDVEIILGDGRLALAREQAQDGSQSFDFLIIDAFNSDTIPVHLLTVEAFAHYVDALAPDGLLAVHASSRHFALIPLIARVSRELGLHGLEIVNNRAPRHHSIASQWVWLSRDADQIEALEERVYRRASALRLKPEMLKLRRFEERDLSGVPLWTDDYSDLLGALERSNGD